ncbi:MAG: riboflavin synthase [Myxococcota bacterium]
MFTGLVQTIGTVQEAHGEAPRRLTVASSLAAQDVAIGESIAIDGCCLTVVGGGAHATTFEVGAETLRRTTLGRLRPGSKVNLERALRLGDLLGGHLVSGHVDAVGRVEALRREGATVFLSVTAPLEVTRLTAARGSIAIAGLSLTVTDVSSSRIVVGLIPHTLAVTTLGERHPGDEVNLEVDTVARYVARLLETGAVSQGPGLTMELLQDKGFT